MAASAGVAMATQIPTRASNGSATASSITRQTAASQPPASTAARTEGTSSIRLQHGATDGGMPGVGWNIAGDQIADQVGIRQLEKFDERSAFIVCRLRVVLAQIAQQQQIQLLHAAAAAPLEALKCAVGDVCAIHVCTGEALVLPFNHHLLDFGDGLGGVEILRAGLGAIHDGVAAVQPERVFEIVEPLARGLVA
jgi:hypothetical protein